MNFNFHLETKQNQGHLLSREEARNMENMASSLLNIQDIACALGDNSSITNQHRIFEQI